MEIEDADRLVAPRRSHLPLVAGAGLLAVVAAAVVAAWPNEPDPTRVMVAVRGCDEGCAEAVRDALARVLSSGGFEVEAAATAGDAEALREAAASAGAEHALLVVVAVHEQRGAGPIDPAYASASATATLSSARGEAAVVVTSPRVAWHARELGGALAGAGTRVAAPLADAVHLALLERASVRAFTEAVVSDAAEARRQSAVRDALPRAPRVHEETARMRESCERAGAELGAGGGQCLSDACAEEYAFDLTADGASALVHVETPAARVPLGGRSTIAERVETEERIELVPLDGSARRVIGRADNYYTYPTYAAGRVVAVEEWPGGFGLVSIDVESGARTPLARFDGRFVQSPELSPDGAHVLYRLRASRRSPARLVVSPVADASTMRLLGEAELASWVTLAVREGEPARSVVAELAPLEAGEREPEEEPADEEVHRLALLDPEDGSTIAFLDDGAHDVDRVAGVHDGRVAFTWRDGRTCGVGLWDPRTGEASHVPTETCVYDARVAGGAVVGTARTRAAGDPQPGRDAELVLVDLVDGSVRALTANGLRERYPRAAGRRVIFDRVGESRYRSFPRVATCWLELPGRD